MQPFHALHGDIVRTSAANFATHGIDKRLQVGNLRFPGRIMNHRGARQKHRRHHHVFRGAHAGIVKMHFSGMHVPSIAMDEPALFGDFHAQLPQARQMQINGPQANLAPARKGHCGLTEPGQNRAQEKNGGTNLFGELVGHLPAMYAATVHRHVPTRTLHPAAQHGQYRRHMPHIRDVRHVMQHNFFWR